MIKDDKKRTHIIVTGKGGGSDAGAVRFDEAQTLTSAEQLQARENIGAISQEDVLNYKQIPSEWDTAHTMADLIADIAADNNAVEGKSYMGTVSLSDLPASLLQGEIMIDIMSVDEGLGKNIRFTLTSSNTAPYHWEYTSAYGATGTWRGFVVDGSLATVAISGDYEDLENRPTIPAAPVQSDWNEADSSSLAYIANKPTIPAAQVNSDWNAVSGVAQILNKPTIPTVPAMATETLTFTLQGGTTKTVEFYTVPNYFYVEDISGSDNTLSITGSNSNPIEIFKSTDRSNWTSMGTTSSTAITATIPANSKLYIKATTTKYDDTYFRATGNHNVGGNSMSLLYGDNFDGKTTLPNSTNTFKGLFWSDTHLVNVDKLELPATSITSYGYKNMFADCSSLTNAPALPATTMSTSCYEGMFQNCTSLVTAPVLPTTNNTGSQCYKNMFNGCTSLNRMVVYATEQTFTTFCISNWLNNVAATGDFYNLGGITYPSGASGIPTGWTEHTSL